MASSVWSGYLTFGLISMPVRLFSGARGERVSFHMLHHDDNTRIKQQLAGHPKIHVHTPQSPALSAGLVAFEIDGMKPDDIVKRLREQKIVASTSPYAVTYARLAGSLANTPEEVDRATQAVVRLAG